MIDKKFSIYHNLGLDTNLVPLSTVATEVTKKNSLLSEENLLSLSYGKIVRKDINSDSGLLPESFDSYNIIKGGDIVLRLTDLQNDKRSLRTGLVQEQGIITSAYTTIRPTKVDSRWLAYTLHAYDVQKVFYSLGSGLRQSMNFVDLKSLPIFLPPIEEQRRIAEYLDKQMSQIESLIELKTRQIDKNRQLVGSEFAEIFLKPTKNSIPLKRLLLDERIGIWGDEPGENELDVTVARVADFNRLTFTLDDATTIRSVTRNQFKSRKVSKGDLLLERSGGGEKSPVGCAVYVTKDIEYLVSSNFVSRLRPATNVSGRYLSFLFAALYMTGQQTPHSSQTTGIQNLNTESYFQTSVPQLEADQQIKLTEKAEKILLDVSHVNSRIESSIEKYRELRISIIASAVNGEVVNREGMSK